MNKLANVIYELQTGQSVDWQSLSTMEQQAANLLNQIFSQMITGPEELPVTAEPLPYEWISLPSNIK